MARFGNNKIDPPLVLLIRREADDGASAPEIVTSLRAARGIDLSVETIRRIIRKESWAWVEEGIAGLPQKPMLGREPNAAELAASQAKLAGLLMEERKGDVMVEELKGGIA